MNELREWLRQNDAILLTETEAKDGLRLEYYLINDRPTLIAFYLETRGQPGAWTVFTTSSITKQDAVLRDAERRLGIY